MKKTLLFIASTWLTVIAFAQRPGAEPGAVAFDAVATAESRGIEAVIVATAGRLQNKTQLMAELAKVRAGK